MSVSRIPAELLFYATPAHECSYLPGRRAVTVFADPGFVMNSDIYSSLSSHGFRRSGAHVYTPRCPDCTACVAVRVRVSEFRPTRRHRRIRRVNSDLTAHQRSAGYDEAHFLLYCRYMQARHPGGAMDNPSREQYAEFLIGAWSNTEFYEFRLGTRLVAVAVADRLRDGLSAVYTFFDPEHEKRSPGVNAVLFEIDEAARLGLDWLYLGYWVEGCQKMEYKSEYLPQERLVGSRWQRVGFDIRDA